MDHCLGLFYCLCTEFHARRRHGTHFNFDERTKHKTNKCNDKEKNMIYTNIVNLHTHIYLQK